MRLRIALHTYTDKIVRMKKMCRVFVCVYCMYYCLCTQQITIVRHRCYALNNNIRRRHHRIEFVQYKRTKERDTYAHTHIPATHIYKKETEIE